MAKNVARCSPGSLKGPLAVEHPHNEPSCLIRFVNEKTHLFIVVFILAVHFELYEVPGPRLPNSLDLDIAHDGELRADARRRKDEMQRDAQI